MPPLRSCAIALVVWFALSPTASHAQTEDRAAATMRLAQAAPDGRMRARTIEVRDVTFGSPDTGLVSIGHIAFVGFVGNGDRMRVERLQIDGMVGRVGARTLEVPSITVTGLAGSMELFRALSEGGTTDRDWAELLRKASADRISAAEIVHRDTSLSSESFIRDFVLTNIKEGFVGSAHLHGMDGRSNSPVSGDSATIHLADVEYEGINVSETLRLFDGAGTGDPKLLLDRAVITGIDIAASEGRLHLDRYELSGVSARAPASTLQAGDWTAIENGKVMEDPQRRERIYRYFSELARHFHVDRLSLEGLTFGMPDQRTTQIAAITISAFGGRGIDLFELKGLDVAGPDGFVRLGRFALERLNYGPFLDAAPDLVSASTENGKIDRARMVEVFPRIAAVRLADVRIASPEGAFSLRRIDAESDDRIGAVPEMVALAIKGLKLEIGRLSQSEARDKLIAMGYAELGVDARISVRFLPTEKSLQIENTSLLIDKVGGIDFSGRIDNVDLRAVLADPEAAGRVRAEVEPKAIEIRIANLGLAESLYAEAAKNAGLPQDAVRETFAAEMRGQALAKIGPALASGAADTLARFLREPDKLVIRVQPRFASPPLTLADINRLEPHELAERITIAIDIPGN